MNRRNTPTLQEAMLQAFRSQLSDLRVALPGRVEAYDSVKRKADIKPLIKRRFPDEEGAVQLESLPVIADVPVIFPGQGAGGGARIVWPLVNGDTGLLLFTDASIDLWLARGGEVDPEDDRQHTISDAVFLPGLADYAHVTTHAVSIEITNVEIRAGGSAALALASELASFRSTYNSHTHAETGSTTAAPTQQQGAMPGTTVLKGS